jgi:hypothetical protein
MNYAVEISTPMNTPQSLAVKTDLRLTEGFLRGGWIYFPPGPAGLLHVQLFREAIQIVPANRGGSLNLADVLAPIDLHLHLKYPPFLITVFTWNLSSLYDHVLTVYLNLQETMNSRTRGDITASSMRADEMLRDLRA